MKTINNIKIFLLVVASIFFTRCNLEQDVAPYLTFDGEANCTIAQLLEYHEVGSTDSFDSIPKGTIITGIIISSDEAGNCYKYLNIQDETGGIQIKINNTALYHNFKIGQRIYVKCDGLVLGDYRKQHQLGWWENGGMEAIPSSFQNTYIFRDSLVGPEPKPATIITSAHQISDNSMYYNMLVQLDSCTFEEGGLATFSEIGTSTSHDITLKDGSTIVLRTSNYASFAQELLPEGTGCIVGILTRYNNYKQLVIRSLDDVKGFSVQPQQNILYQVDFSSNPLDAGWSAITNTGADWSYLNNEMFKGFYINGLSTGNNSWLVSPTLPINSNNATLSFSHRSLPDGVGSNNIMKLYYTTGNSSNLLDNNWIELPINNFSASFNTISIALPNDIISNPNFRLAFQLNNQSTASWYINNISITALTK